MKVFAIILLCSLFSLISTRRLKDQPSKNGDIICPDAVSVCSDTSTCCISTDGAYSCCPFQNAVCCDDHVHCCPQAYKCNLKIFKCDRVFGSLPLYRASSPNTFF